MKKIGPEITRELINASRTSPRLRSHHNIHDSLDEEIQRLLICLQPGTYIRPHFHPEADKKEMIILLQGKCTCINFDEQGNISDQVTLDSKQGITVSEFPPSKYHSIYCHDEDTIIMEVKKGPYAPLPPECFASWSPEESSPEKAQYLSKLSEMIPN